MFYTHTLYHIFDLTNRTAAAQDLEFCLFNFKFITLMKNEMVLDTLEVQELSFNEEMEVEGGFLPLVVIGACWGIMACSSLVAVGIGIKHGVFSSK